MSRTRSRSRPLWVVLILALVAGAVGTASATPTPVDRLTLIIDITARDDYATLPRFKVQADFAGQMEIDWATGAVSDVALTEIASTRVLIPGPNQVDWLDPTVMMQLSDGIGQSTVSVSGSEATFDLYLDVAIPIDNGWAQGTWHLVNVDGDALGVSASEPFSSLTLVASGDHSPDLWNKALIDRYGLENLKAPYGTVSADGEQSPVPEPATLLMLGVGFLAAAGRRVVRKE